MADLGDPPFDDEVAAEVDSPDVPAPEEDDREPAGLISEGEFEAHDLLGPWLYPHGLDPSGHLDVIAPGHLGDGGDTFQRTFTQ